MYAIAFDLIVAEIKKEYGDPYNGAYQEISKELKKFGFENTQGSVYISKKADLKNLYQAINKLSQIDWFKKSVRDIRAFKVQDWSDFTDIVKGDS